jgi:uncharacterized protein
MKRAFIDTSLLIALYVERDAWHDAALAAASALEAGGTQFYTTDAVLTEFCNSLAHVGLRRQAVAAVEALEARDDVVIVRVDERLWRKALVLFTARTDKAWGLTDCISFEAMKSARITAALTADHHFAQAGFQTLLKR